MLKMFLTELYHFSFLQLNLTVSFLKTQRAFVERSIYIFIHTSDFLDLGRDFPSQKPLVDPVSESESRSTT